MYYRTRTYIAADWSGDYDAVEQLHKWNSSRYWSLSFTDAHDLMQARDNSLNCSIKASLSKQCEVEVASIVKTIKLIHILVLVDIAWIIEVTSNMSAKKQSEMD